MVPTVVTDLRERELWRGKLPLVPASHALTIEGVPYVVVESRLTLSHNLEARQALVARNPNTISGL